MNVKKDRKVYLIWFVVFVLWSLYRVYFRFPEWVDELLVKPFLFIVPVVYWVKKKERRKLSSLGLTKNNLFGELYIGFGIGALFAVEGLVANYIKYGTFSFVPINALSSVGLFSFLIYTIFTAVSEEIFARGYVYSRIVELKNNQLISSLISSFLFLLLHIPILFTRLNLNGSAFVIYIISIFLLGVTNCYLYSSRKSLVVPILVHVFWNATVALYL